MFCSDEGHNMVVKMSASSVFGCLCWTTMLKIISIHWGKFSTYYSLASEFIVSFLFHSIMWLWIWWLAFHALALHYTHCNHYNYIVRRVAARHQWWRVNIIAWSPATVSCLPCNSAILPLMPGYAVMTCSEMETFHMNCSSHWSFITCT